MAYKVPFVDVPAHFSSLQPFVLDTIKEVLLRGNLILRDELREFEKKFSSFIGTKFAVGVNSGTDALFLSLKAIGVTKGDEVITVSHTCIATLAAVVNAGATPVLVDVGEDFNMDMNKLENAITPNTRVIMPVHLNGRACDMDKLTDIARKHNLIIVEDAAQGLGAKFDGRMVGSLGLVAGFSLYPFKMLGAFGDGGIVTTNDPEIARKVSVLRDYGEDRETGEILYFGFNSRLDNLQAALLSLKLEYLPEWINRRREIARMYKDGLSGIPYLKLPHFPGEEYFDVYLNYTVCSSERDELVRYLKERGVEPLTPISLIKPLHCHEALGLERFSLPQTERIAKEFLYLPINPELRDEQVEYVIECIRTFYRKLSVGSAR